MIERVPSACPHDCPDACSFLVRRLGSGEGVAIEAGNALPLQRGWVCSKGKRWELRQRAPQRLKMPLKKEGGRWKEISWGDAWSLWAEKLMISTEKHGPLANMFYQSAGSQYFSKRFAKEIFSALGGYTEPAGSLCGAGGGAGLRVSFGHTPVYTPEELSRVKGILLWGRNALETHPHLVPILRDLESRSGACAAIEIRTTPTTQAVGRWWRIRPGSDSGLAMLLCKKILERGRAAEGWVDRTLNGEDFRTFVLSANESDLLTETGLQYDEVESLYQWLMVNKPLAIYGGYGIQRYMAGSFTFQVLTALAVLLGGFSDRGTGVVFGKDEMRFFPEQILGTPAVKRKIPVSRWHLMTTRVSPPVKTVLFTCANPAKQGPATEELPRAIAGMEFSVCIDLEMTETAALCDLVLPAACFLEEGPDWRGSWWHRYLLRSEKVIDPPGHALPEPSILTGLGQALGLGVDLERKREVMDRILLESNATEALGEGVFRTCEPHGWSCSAKPVRLPCAVPLSPANRGRDTLRLVTVHCADYINGQSWGVPAAPFPTVIISPSEGKGRGLKEADRVRLKCGNTEITATLRFDNAMDSGYCVMVQGQAQVNSLTTAKVSPGYGAPFHESFVTMEKEPESDADA